MLRRVCVSQVRPGAITIEAAEAHHLLHVLRLTEGTQVEVFDAAGRRACGVLQTVDGQLSVHVEAVTQSSAAAVCTIASAVPKGSRADWLVEKLSELGVGIFQPLITARSVVDPGTGKLQRWQRLAEQAARQSRRAGVMQVLPPLEMPQVLAQHTGGQRWYLSTAPQASSAIRVLACAAPPRDLLVLIGPEGGWTPEEMAHFNAAGLRAVSLGATTLRVETAAIAVAAILAAGAVPGNG